MPLFPFFFEEFFKRHLYSPSDTVFQDDDSRDIVEDNPIEIDPTRGAKRGRFDDVGTQITKRPLA